MILRLGAIAGLTILLAAGVLGDDADARDKLLGKWHPAATADSEEAWSLETIGDALRISHSLKQKTDQIECNIMGKDCDVKLGGHKATVSLWFSGSMLVEMETRGKEVTKRRFHVDGDDTLKLEVIPIEPPGKAETAEYKRMK
jgi:hypothetical protein